MDRLSLLEAFIDSHPDPVVIAGTDHRVLLVNRAAQEFFEGGRELEGKNLFECHNEQSRRKLSEALTRLAAGEAEVQITERPGQRTFMRAIRDRAGTLLGYYERYTYFPDRIA